MSPKAYKSKSGQRVALGLLDYQTISLLAYQTISLFLTSQ
jgi:hypothetical protein